ncbi:MAG: F0F1 ATP synthase subunit delta [Candidatus Pacebacteria bacterium]|nr:F0F1 ATP synthase subunit delta [Candidatus Paceibacterota bacterium]
MKAEKQISSWARAVCLAIEENPEKAEEVFKNLKKQLGNNKEKYHTAIVKKAYQLYEKEKRAELILSTDFDEDTKKKIKERLKQEVKGIEEISEKVDTDLIAGFRLKTKNVLVKASLKDVLIGLKNKTYGHN